MRRQSPSAGGSLGRIGMAMILVIISLTTYFCSTQQNPVTGEEQRVAITPDQEIALGLQAEPTMVAQYGGEAPDPQAQALVDQIGEELVLASNLDDSPWQWEFHLLDDPQTVNAFALPGGQVFITTALFNLLETEGELAGILGHEIGHVIERHSAQQLAKARLTEGLTGAAVMASYDPEDPSSQRSAQVVALVGQLVNLRFGRDDELESDRTGLRYMAAAGYDPRALITVMEKLAQAGGGQSPPEFFSTHPNPENRIERIQAEINELYPDGVPAGLTP
jgi:beta-barrel assembly-enhancing protease